MYVGLKRKGKGNAICICALCLEIEDVDVEALDALHRTAQCTMYVCTRNKLYIYLTHKHINGNGFSKRKNDLNDAFERNGKWPCPG
jgi:hypothetical protein